MNCISSILVLATTILLGPTKTAKCQVQLPTGRYTGLHDPDAQVTVYYGIPYGHATRFQPPAPIGFNNSSQDRQVDATSHGPACINFNLPSPYQEVYNALFGAMIVEPQAEDCLSLDVYVPDGPTDAKLPVLFFSPGGTFTNGASFGYDMRPLVSRSINMSTPFIGVVINYRLGPLGFLNPSTTRDWNVGILDQFEALRWVGKNIAAFGGDKDKVTIMGQSAGAESTLYQLLWSDEQLFRGAWMASVPSSGVPMLRTSPKAKDELVSSFAVACGCPANNTLESSISCLRNTSVSTLVNVSGPDWLASGPSLGGNLLKSNTFRQIRSSKYPKVPLVFSTCRDEGTFQAFGFNSSSDDITSLAVQNIAQGASLSPNDTTRFTEEMLRVYPDDPAKGCPFDGNNTTYGLGSQYKRMAAIFTDVIYAEAWNEYLQSFSSDTKTWGLLFETPITGIPEAFGVLHISDVPYYFPLLLGPMLDPRSQPQTRKVVDVLQSALINFVSDLDPNGKSAASPKNESFQWPLFKDRHQVLSLSAQKGAVVVDPPQRPGFDVLKAAVRPEGF